MTGRRFLVLAIAALAVVVAAPIVLLLVVGTDVPSAEAEASASASAPEVVVQPDVGEIAWVYAPPPGAGNVVESYALQAGTLDQEGPLVDLEVEWQADLGADLARQPPVGPPTGGAVVYVADDGASSAVHRAEIAPNGRDEVLAELVDVVWDIAVAPDGSAAYAALVERGNTEHDLGVVRVLLDGSGAVEPVMPPAQLAGPGGITRVAFISFNVELALSGDGRQLVRRSCVGSEGCLTEILDLAGGRARQLPEGDVVGVGAGAIVMNRCGMDGCQLEAVDLDTGVRLPLEDEPIGRVISVRGAPVFVSQSTENEQRTVITASDLASGERRELYRTPDGAHASLDLHLHLAMSLPEGFVHVTESIPIGEEGAVVNLRQRELLISVADGREVEIPPAPFRPPPGFDRQG